MVVGRGAADARDAGSRETVGGTEYGWIICIRFVILSRSDVSTLISRVSASTAGSELRDGQRDGEDCLRIERPGEAALLYPLFGVPYDSLSIIRRSAAFAKMSLEGYGSLGQEDRLSSWYILGFEAKKPERSE